MLVSKTLILGIVTIAVLVISVSTVLAQTSGIVVRPKGLGIFSFDKIWDAIMNLQGQILNLVNLKQGPPGPAGPAGPKGQPGTCSCEISKADYDVLAAKVAALESLQECVSGQTAACGTSNVGECKMGTKTCVNFHWGPCVGAVNPSPEVCDGKDNNCNGQVDENLGSTTCGQGACMRTVQNCVGGVPNSCVPGTPSTEVCNGIDDNCNGETDEGNLCPGGYCLNGACTTGCAVDGDCISGYYCVSNTCVPKLSNGHSCTTSNSCISGYCADGVCCDSACSGQCDSCSVGTCTILAEGSAGSPSCGSYLCDGISASCPTSCTADPQCSFGNHCVSGVCQP